MMKKKFLLACLLFTKITSSFATNLPEEMVAEHQTYHTAQDLME